MKYNISDIKEYLYLEHPSLMKGYLITWIVLISYFGIIIAICDPFVPYIFCILISIVVGMDLLAIYILSNREKRQKLYILFVGIYSFALSIVLYLSFFKTVYMVLKVRSPLPFIVTIIIYLLILILGFIMLKHALKSGYYSGNKNSKKNIKGIGAITGMSGIGVFIGKMLIRNTEYQTIMLVFALTVLFLSYIMILGMHNIYKYYLVKKYNMPVREYKNLKKAKKVTSDVQNR